MFGWTILPFRLRPLRTRIIVSVMVGIMIIGSIWLSWMGWWRTWQRFGVRLLFSNRCHQSRHSQLELLMVEWLVRSIWVLGFCVLSLLLIFVPFFLSWIS